MGWSSLTIATDNGDIASDGTPMRFVISNLCLSSDNTSHTIGIMMYPKNAKNSIASSKHTYNSSFSIAETLSLIFFPNKNHSIHCKVPLPLHMVL